MLVMYVALSKILYKLGRRLVLVLELLMVLFMYMIIYFVN